MVWRRRGCPSRRSKVGAAWWRRNLAGPDTLECLFTAKIKTPHSLPWLAAIQIVEREKDLPSLTPEGSFIATEAVEGIIGQITEPQKTACQLNIRRNLALG